MKSLILCLCLMSCTVHAQDQNAFAKAIQRDNPLALDRWIKRELHKQRNGTLVTSSSTTCTVHSPTYDRLVTWLREQPGVMDVAWDRCVTKIAIWPGHSTLGVQLRMNGQVIERCYTMQEGRPGTIRLFDWQPRVRKSREELKLVAVKECIGFVEKQHRNCKIP
ncbi:MAG: hypothetical protein KA408_14205 [Flavobacteriales bacterium]|nr:hypothetical protein [Flavobacteriales bacterium]